METKHKTANFYLRLLASLIDTLIFVTANLAFFSFISQSRDLQNLTLNLLIYLCFVLSPIGILYSPLFTHYLQATPGKLLTGLRVTDLNGHKLGFKRVLFRQTLGYSFSWTFFGLGYLAVIKNPQHQSWHDQAVGSKVLVYKNLTPVGVLVLILLITLCSYLLFLVITNFSSNTGLTNELKQAFPLILGGKR